MTTWTAYQLRHISNQHCLLHEMLKRNYARTIKYQRQQENKAVNSNIANTENDFIIRR